MDRNFKQCEYIFNRGNKKGSKCTAKTLNQYCKKHSKTKSVHMPVLPSGTKEKVIEIPIEDNNVKEGMKVEEVKEDKKKV